MVYKIEGKTRVLEEKTLLEQTKRARTTGQNKLNWPTIGIDAGIGTQATLLAGQCSPAAERHFCSPYFDWLRNVVSDFHSKSGDYFGIWRTRQRAATPLLLLYDTETQLSRGAWMIFAKF